MTFNFFARISLFLAALALAGCAVPNRSLTKGALTQLGPVQGVISVPQSNLQIVVQPISTYIAFPHRHDRMRYEMIDAIRQSDAERIAEPMLVKLRDYEFAKALQNESQAIFNTAKNYINLNFKIINAEVNLIKTKN